MLNISEDYAKDYNILFNIFKVKLIFFLMLLIVTTFYVSSDIYYVQQCVHLGTTIVSDISIKCIDNVVKYMHGMVPGVDTRK